MKITAKISDLYRPSEAADSRTGLNPRIIEHVHALAQFAEKANPGDAHELEVEGINSPHAGTQRIVAAARGVFYAEIEKIRAATLTTRAE